MRAITTLIFASLIALPVAASAQDKQEKKQGVVIGLGLASDFGPESSNTNSLVARVGVTPEIVLNGHAGVSVQRGDFNEGSGYGLGASAQYRVFKHDGLFFHMLGGFSYNKNSSEEVDIDTDQNGNQTITTITTSQSWVSVYGGFGAEYFFPNTRRFSLQADVGPTIQLLSADVEAEQGNVTQTVEQDAWRIELGDMLSGGIVFTYYFGDAW